ncbi:MAG: MEDS domain-containing protein [Bacillota bacterium]
MLNLNQQHNRKERLRCAICELKIHDHICSIYETKDEQFSAVVPYIQDGLQKHEKCVYIADENSIDEVVDLLKNHIPEIEKVMENNSLVIISKEESYLRLGYFDPDWMMNFLIEQVKTAKTEGFNALRVTGEASWALGDNLMTQQLIEYESKVNNVLQEIEVSALCQYNKKHFTPDIVKNVIETHPVVIYKNHVCKNYNYIPTDEFLSERDKYDEATRMLNQILLIENYVESLKESEERFRRAITNAPLPVMINVKFGRVLMLNKMWTQVTGYSIEEIPTVDAWMYKAYGLEKEEADSLGRSRFLDSEVSNLGMYTITTKSGDKKVLEFYSSPIGISSEGEEILIITAVDITDLMNKEKELIAAKTRAEEATKLKSEFLAQISHEIRSPINTMLNYISLIKEMAQEIQNPDLDYSFEAIDSSSRRLVRTIDLVLNVSQLQTGLYECNFREIDLELNIIIPLVREMQSSAKAKGLKLIHEGESDESKVRADEYTVTQIFQNLIDNAIKYTKEGEIRVTTRGLDNKVEVIVSDTGIGMSEEFLEKLFDPFTQEEQGYTRKYEGSGLGLALVNGYCRLNNAAIRVESLKGKGTSFFVSFIK